MNYALAPKKATAELDNWQKFGGRLAGFVTGHPEIEDGKHVITSSIIWESEDGLLVETRNTMYRLGTRGGY